MRETLETLTEEGANLLWPPYPGIRLFTTSPIQM